jgi:hypothetical protein
MISGSYIIALDPQSLFLLPIRFTVSQLSQTFAEFSLLTYGLNRHTVSKISSFAPKGAEQNCTRSQRERRRQPKKRRRREQMQIEIDFQSAADARYGEEGHQEV